MSKNSEAAKILREIAFILQTEEEKESEPNAIFKVRSYNRAADEIQNLSFDIGDIYKKDKLKWITKNTLNWKGYCNKTRRIYHNW